MVSRKVGWRKRGNKRILEEMNIDAVKTITNFLIVMAIVGSIPLLPVLAQEEEGISVAQKDLPILPIE
jgi:hypothetical protein